MDHSVVSLLIHRISSGKYYFSHKNTNYILIQANNDIKYQAELLYSEYIEKYKYEILWSKDTIKNLLKYLKLWSDDNETYLKELEKKIDTLKLNLFLSKLNKEKVAQYRKDLMNTRETINKLYNKKHSLDYLTIEDGANITKNEFIMIHTIMDNKLNPVFSSNPSDIDYTDFIDITTNIAQNFITIESYKSIARSDQWKSIWNANKNNLFNKSAYELSDEQKTLVSLSNMYDRIYEHPECPEEYVINDDDMLDGWMINQKNKADKTKKQNNANELNSRHKNAKEIFVVGDKEDIDNIMSLNSNESMITMKQRKKAIKSNEDGIDEVYLPDVQRELLQQVNSKR